MPPPPQAISWVLACPLHSYVQAALLMTVSSVKPFKGWTWGSWKLFHHDSVSRSHHTSTYSLSMHSLAPFRQGHKGHTNATRRNRNVRYYLSSNKMVWLHFHSLLALSRVRGTLVFLPYIKVIAVLQTPKDTSLPTLQHDGFSSFVTHGKQDLSLLHRHLAPHAGHHRIIMVGKALQDWVQPLTNHYLVN